MSKHGTVQLKSGKWDWTLREQASGAAVIFQHRERQKDQMRSWSPDTELDDARALALEPIERFWADSDGLVWTIRVILPTDWARPDRAPEERAMRLTFTYGTITRSASIPFDSKAGELTHSQLIALFNDSL